MHGDLRRTLDQIDSMAPHIEAASGFGGPGISAGAQAWLVSELQARGWTKTDELFGRGPHGFERAINDARLVRPWQPSHDWGVRIYRAERTDERFLGAITSWVEPVALKVKPARFEAATLDLFAGVQDTAPKPRSQEFLEAVCALTGYQVNHACAEYIQWTGPDEAWAQAAKARLLMQRIFSGWQVNLERDRYWHKASLELCSPEGVDELPEDLDLAQFMAPLAQLRQAHLATVA